MIENKPIQDRHEVLLIIAIVLLALILLVGTGLGFYFMGVSQSQKSGTATGSSGSTISGTVAQPNDTSTNSVAETGTGESAGQIEGLLNGLRGTSGSFDIGKVESTLSDLLGKSGSGAATTLTLVGESAVHKNNQSGKSAVQSYLQATAALVAGSQTGGISENAISQIFGGDTSILEAEAAKHRTVLAGLEAVSTPNEAILIQRQYLTLYASSIAVLDGERAMLASGSVDYAIIGKAQGILALSKELDQNIAALKAQFGI